MSGLDVVVTGERTVALKLDQFPQSLHDPLKRIIAEAIGQLAGRVRAAMPVKTGKARGSVESEIFDDSGKRIVGYVSVSEDFAKVGALEYGDAGRATKVKAHKARLDHVFADRLNAPLTVMVGAYSRQPNIAAHRMFRGAKQALNDEIVAQMQEVVDKASAGFNAE